MRVAVIFGGPSEERHVSIESGLAVAGALEAEGCAVLRMRIDDSVLPHIDRLRSECDVAFIALHGRYGEDGGIQGELQAAGIAYTGSGPEASRLAMDKAGSKEKFQAGGIRTPKYHVAKKTEPPPKVDFGLPVVVKPAASGSSIGVRIVRREEDLLPALEDAWRFSDLALIEEYVRGRELSVSVLEGRALAACELRTARDFYDHEAKYSDEATTVECPAALSPETARLVAESAVAAFVALGCRDIGRTDVMLDSEGLPWVLEVNTIPGFTSHSLVPKAAAACGIPFGRLCVRLAELALERKARDGEEGDPALGDGGVPQRTR